MAPTPAVPTPFTGAIYILTPDRVHPLNIPLTHAIKVVSQWGSGCRDLIAAMETSKMPRAVRAAMACGPCGEHRNAARLEDDLHCLLPGPKWHPLKITRCHAVSPCCLRSLTHMLFISARFGSVLREHLRKMHLRAQAEDQSN
jgi:hypothetical protein